MLSSTKPKGAYLKVPWLKRIALFVCLLAGLLLAVIAIATFEAVTHLGGSTVDCGAPPPYIKPSSPDQAVFTAHVFYVGRVDRIRW
jgi:hypothetical protein